jgi:Protein of unknown function DUF262
MADEDNTLMETGTEPDVQLVNYDITASPNDFNVVTIFNYIDQGAIVIPPYQRNYTWDRKRASKLIESLIIGLPVPQVFLYEESRNKFAILDGQQRLLSIYFFKKKRFPKADKRAELRDIFSEAGVFPPAILANEEYFENFNIQLPALGGEARSPLHGLNYDTLEDYQSAFDLRPVRCVIIKQNEPDDDNSSVYEIFDRLNTGGINLKPQQIRSNLYYSKFYETLAEINKWEGWRSVFGKETRDKDLRDVELLLRAFAMLVYSDKYRPSMTRFLNRFSNHAKKRMSVEDVAFLVSLFRRFLDAIENLPPEAFQAAERFSIGIFESAFVGRCSTLWEERSDAPVQPISTHEISQLSAAIRPFLQEGTTKQANVVERLRIAREILGG